MTTSRFICIAAVFLAGCAPTATKKPEETKEKTTTEPPRLVGRVASVPRGKNFVLIQSYEKWDAAVGTILTTRGADKRTANLITTGESMGQFVAADVQAGELETGDAVYSRHVPKPPETEPSETPATAPIPELPEPQSTAPAENVQKNN